MGDALLVLLCKDIRLLLRRTQELEPSHLGDAGPFRPGRRAENVVYLVELVDLPPVAREDGVLGEDLDEHASRAPDVDGRSVLGLAE
jgi:hypothetical protein